MIQRYLKMIKFYRQNKLFDFPSGLLSYQLNRHEHSETMTKEKLIAVQVVFRHGDRTPLASYPGDPHKDYFRNLGDFGELTNLGKYNQYKLGQWLRDRYDHLLPKKYSPKDITVVSNDVDRCIMSASCNLTGLYPPQKEDMWHKEIPWQPIPVHIDLNLMDPIPHIGQLHALKKFQEFFDEKTKEYAPMMKYISEKTGQKIDSLWNAIVYRDIFAVQTSQNLPLPEWAKTVYPTPLETMATEMFAIGSTIPQTAQFAIGPILKSIIDHFEKPSKKMLMYSGHDYTISILLGVLAPHYQKFVPEFSSTIIFELLEKDDKKIVRMLLKRNDNLETIPILSDTEITEFEDFKEKTKPWCITLEEKMAIFKNIPNALVDGANVDVVEHITKPNVNFN